MDPIQNLYAPGAGTRPPELAGRDELRETVRVVLARVQHGHSAKSVLMVGLRGVGKTVLLDRMREEAEEAGLQTLFVEASEERSLPATLAPQLRQALLKLSGNAMAQDMAQRGLRAIAGFVQTLKVKFQDIEVALDFDPEPGLADNGNLEQDLTEMLLAAGAAAKKAETVLSLFVDELQYINEDELAALITALHRAAQRQAPVVLVGAGLPQLRARMGNARSYAERMFDVHEVGPLAPEAARRAIEKPARDEGVAIDDNALQRIFEMTHGYPYFLQEWDKYAWDIADTSPISLGDVERAWATAYDAQFTKRKQPYQTQMSLATLSW
ncbi:MAG: ATP-binding protein [Aphanocapsa feldmannii 277cV]|uniref:ATP-binding protein n=1 Tax=Aphanocapsa feldmannii 277cV TaxID=2507553 RepID=A0A524RKK7_9CHRO|nr:MAG: ATP-binding protein [Aphanocapsa feldmannii 277cV]